MKTKERNKQIIGFLFLIMLLYWSVNNIDTLSYAWSRVFALVLPFIMGAGLAFVLNLPLKFFEKYLTKLMGKYYRWYRPLGILFGFLLIITVISFVIFLVLPDLQDTLASFIEVVPNEINRLVNWINDYFANNPQIIEAVGEMNLDIESIRSQAIETVQNIASGALGSFVTVLTGVVNSVFNTFVALVFAVFILSGKENLGRHFKKMIYGTFKIDWANYIVNVSQKANEVFSNFISGQVTEAFVNGILFYVGMWMFNFPYRLSISVLTGVLSLVPIFGAIIGGALGAILIAAVSFPKGLWFIVFTVVVQQIESNVFYPRVVGNSVGLPGIWVMFAVTVGGGLFGLPGMILSVPTLSLFYQLTCDTVNYQLERKRLNIQAESSDL